MPEYHKGIDQITKNITNIILYDVIQINILIVLWTLNSLLNVKIQSVTFLGLFL